MGDILWSLYTKQEIGLLIQSFDNIDGILTLHHLAAIQFRYLQKGITWSLQVLCL